MMKTAEAVTPKHPDKMCDQISDALLDWCLLVDPNARVAIETLGGHGKVYIVGEVTLANSDEWIMGKLATYASEVVKRVSGDPHIQVSIDIKRQSPEIAQGVDAGGAGDQGIMVGYACDDNEEMIPQELYLARSLCKFIFDQYPYDGKTQITILENGNVGTIVASFQKVTKEDLLSKIWDWIGEDVKHKHFSFEDRVNILCNPAGDWNQGGFDADTGLTGRKLMVDNYGPQIPIGGGCFSGKDATKVDRSAAYMARRLAVGLLKQRNAHEVIVKLAYAIGVAEPVMVTATIDGLQSELPVAEIKLLTPKGIIEALDLKNPIYEKTAQWGHFGNGFPWDKVEHPHSGMVGFDSAL